MVFVGWRETGLCCSTAFCPAATVRRACFWVALSECCTVWYSSSLQTIEREMVRIEERIKQVEREVGTSQELLEAEIEKVQKQVS